MFSGIPTLDNALEEQVNLQDAIEKFKGSTKLKIPEKKEQKSQNLNNAIRLPKRTQKVLNDFESKIFPTKKY